MLKLACVALAGFQFNNVKITGSFTRVQCRHAVPTSSNARTQYVSHLLTSVMEIMIVVICLMNRTATVQPLLRQVNTSLHLKLSTYNIFI